MCLEYVSFCRITFVNGLEASLRKQQNLFLSRITALDSRMSYPRAKWATITSSSLELLAFLIKARKSQTIKQHISHSYRSLFRSVDLTSCGQYFGVVGAKFLYTTLRSPGASTSRAAIPLKPSGSYRSRAHPQGAHPQGASPAPSSLPCDTTQLSSVFAFGKHHAAQLNRTAGGQSVQEGPLVVSCHLKKKDSIFIKEHVHRQVALQEAQSAPVI